MRLPLIVLLSLAAVFTGGVSATATANVHSIVVNRDNAPSKRLLRSDTTTRIDGDDNGEERAAPLEGLTKLLKPSTLSAVQRQEAALAKLTSKHPYSITEAFKSLKLDKFKNVKKLKVKDVDALFTGKKYDLWYTYLGRWNNRQRRDYRTNVFKVFKEELGMTQALNVFAVASTSKNPKVMQMSNNVQGQLLREFSNAGDDFDRIALQLGEAKAGTLFYNAIKSSSDSDSGLGERYTAKLLTKWATEGKSHDQVVKMVPSVGDEYTNMLLSLAMRANGRANDEAKAAAAAAKAAKAAAAATRV